MSSFAERARLPDVSGPMLSVIMPVYNVERFVGAALDSVLSQDFREFELIVVDDGSTDGTPRLVSDRAARDARLRLIRQPNSGRPSIPRNRGMAEARGNIITFLDGDDLYLPGRLAHVVAVFDAFPEVEVVFHDLLKVSADGQPLSGTYLQQFGFPDSARDVLTRVNEQLFLASDGFYRYASAVYCPLLMPTVSVRAGRVRREPAWFREDMRCGEDIDFWFRLLLDSRAAYVDRPLAAYRYRTDSTTQNKEDFYLGTLRAHQMNLVRGGERLTEAERLRYVKRIADRYQHLAYHYVTHGEPQKARDSYREAFRLRRDWRVPLRYAKTFVPRPLRRDGPSAG